MLQPHAEQHPSIQPRLRHPGRPGGCSTPAFPWVLMLRGSPSTTPVSGRSHLGLELGRRFCPRPPGELSPLPVAVAQGTQPSQTPPGPLGWQLPPLRAGSGQGRVNKLDRNLLLR